MLLILKGGEKSPLFCVFVEIGKILNYSIYRENKKLL